MNNSTEYSATTDSPASGFTLTLYLLLPIKICLCILTALLNSCIVVIIIFMIKRRTYSNFIFLSMAIADSIVGFSSLPFMTIYTTFGYWPLGYSACAFWIINDWTSCTISLCNLFLISVHRYIQIKWPTSSNETLSLGRKVLLVGVWVICYGCWTTSVLFVTSHDFVPEACYFSYTFAYVTISDIFSFFLPIFMILVFNFLTFTTLKQKRTFHPSVHAATSPIPKLTQGSKEASNNVNSVSRSAVMTSQMHASTVSSPGLLTSSSRHKKDKNAFLCLICIMANLLFNWIIFLVCWPILADCPTCVNSALYEVCYWTVYLYSAINPIILFKFNESFRIELKNMIKSIRNIFY